MAKPTVRALVLADFNAANFAAHLAGDTGEPQVAVTVGAIGDLGGDPDQHDVAIVWMRAQAMSPAFAALVDRGVVVLSDVMRDVDAFVARIERLRDRCSRVVVMTGGVPRLSAAFGALAMKEGVGLANVVMRMNLRLAERVDDLPGVVLLDASAWMDAEPTPEEAKLWYAAKIPFRNDVFRRAARQVKSLLRASRGQVRKFILLDLDDTLWGGLVGEVGWRGLRLGGHDPTGEAYVDFQRTLLALSHRGLLLGVVSKNDQAVALEALASHPEMVLRVPQLSGWRINWDDKAANIVALAEELNVGLEAVVFIDDSAAERVRVREALPAVFVPEWPASPMRYVDALLGLDCFDTVALTEEDRTRSALYAAERARVADRGVAESVGEWLERLELRVEVEEFNDRNGPRAVQLLNKTNQMNLSTRRLEAAELAAWLGAGRRRLWTVRVRDRFGDAGLTGLASLEIEGTRAVLVDFVLSCRVFGRRVEEAMLHVVTESALESGAAEFVATLTPTGKNAPCLRFLERSGLRRDDGDAHQFRFDLATAYPRPREIELQREMAPIA
jgi:FkbH-like protein